MNFRLSLVSLLFVVGYSMLPPCGKDFFYSDVTDKCYFFSAECAKFGEAEKLCKEMNANLTAIRSKAENEVVYDLSQLNFPPEERHFWIGSRVALTDPPQYVWLTGEDFGFHRIYEPFNCLEERCVAGSLSRNQWLATKCEECFHFVCEAKREVITCPAGYSYFNKTNACYKYVADAADWEHHEKKCVEDSGHLASIHSLEETDFILGLLENTTYKFWLGAKAAEHPDFQWTDNSLWDFTNWVAGRFEKPPPQCLLAYGSKVFDKRVTGKWNGDKCDEALPAICKYMGIQKSADTDENGPGVLY
ncbi:hypothetical protein QR680_011767 [Steinernema hermaphroditum]|uniref:C-type lectin domain-containing protein n=1 Tax=Steinernema hermaphroditum TaxID=289476 RepID=A0AA39I1Y8_9BILA|nr:hypothetical protein QR680_011767 [Steinernema hermaphroditum]